MSSYLLHNNNLSPRPRTNYQKKYRTTPHIHSKSLKKSQHFPLSQVVKRKSLMITTHVIYFVTLGPHRQTKRMSDDGLHHKRTISGLKSDIVLNTKKFRCEGLPEAEGPGSPGRTRGKSSRTPR